MRRWGDRSGSGADRRPFPESNPPGVNHVVLTGTLAGDPREGEGPSGDRVALLRIEFPVADPDCPQILWTWAQCEVEAAGELADRAKDLRRGTEVIVAGQLSEDREGAGAVVLASLIHPGAEPGAAAGPRRPRGRR
jgi:primosomal replication protein N